MTDQADPERALVDRYQEFHEVWWIHSGHDEMWAGLRIAHFRKSMDGALIVIITGEPPDRTGLRIWDDIAKREGWRKVRQIAIPTREEIDAV